MIAPAVEDANYRAWYPLVLIFAVLVLGIFAGGALSYRTYERHFRTGIEQRLSAIAELKANDLALWRMERLGDANILFKNASFSGLVRRFLDRPDDAEAQAQLRAWLEKSRAANRYERIFLLDAQGVERMSTAGTAGPAAAVVSRRAGEILRSREVGFQDFYRNEQDQRVYLATLVPILDGPDFGQALGVLVLNIDPVIHLYPAISRWPTPSRTAETLLVRRDGHDALFLNELRFQTNSALKLRIPLERTNVPAVKAALGQQGIVEGIDYRGEPVAAALCAIPDSPWSMVARMDTAEVYAPLRERLWLTVLLMGALLLGAGASVGLVWRQQRIHYYRARHEATEALIASEVRYRRLFESAKDGVLILDAETGMVVDVNPFLIELLGFSHEHFLGKKLWELGFFKDIVANQAHFAELQQKEYIRYEDRALKTADGRRIEVQFVSNVYQVNHHRVVQCNIRDITDRKQAEQALREREARFAALFEHNPIQTIVVDLHGRIQAFNRAKRESGDRLPQIGDILYRDYAGKHTTDMHRELMNCIGSGKSRHYPEQPYGERILSIDIAPFTDGAIITSQDITERKHAEEVLRELWLQLSQVQDEERRRLARELHDSTGQKLAALSMTVGLLQDATTAPGRKTEKMFADCLAMIEQCAQEIRTLSYLLHPPLLDELGLAAAIGDYVEGFSKRSGVQVALDAPPDLERLPPEAELALFRVMQESLGNIHRHAGASAVRIHLACDAEQVTLEVSDEGRGMSAETIRAIETVSGAVGVGIAGMRERLRLLGGRLEIKSGKCGTTVLAIIPRPQEPA
jgi:PAS domain S-box-containing protein